MNETEFENAYQTHASGLLRYCLRFVSSRDQAEELVHDVFVELIRGKFSERSGDGQDLKGWLYTVARNKCLNQTTRSREIAADDEVFAKQASPEANAEEALLERAQNAAVLRARDTLPGDLLATLTLRESGLSYEEIAAKLNIPIGTVKSRFHRLVQHMRQEIDV